MNGQDRSAHRDRQSPLSGEPELARPPGRAARSSRADEPEGDAGAAAPAAHRAVRGGARAGDWEMTAELSAALGLEGEPAAARQLGGEAGRGGRKQVRRPAGAAAPVQLQSDPSAEVTEEYLLEIRQRLLELGIREAQLGKFHLLSSWPRARIESAWRLFLHLNRYAHRANLGPEDRLIQAWNAGLDDLGVNRGRGRHLTVLHFADSLDQWARATFGTDYLGALGRFRRVRLAGAAIPVHPRALYFTAAAQAGMDRRAGIEAGEGHYIPAGGFRRLLSEIADQAKRLARVRARGPVRRGDKPSAPTPLAGGARLYGILLAELRRARLVMAEQSNPQGPDLIEGHSPDEHREPLMRAYFERHGAELEALPQVSSDAEVPAAATALLKILEDAPRLAHHGAGSVDPHGTDHAMGIAIDLYNGAGRNRDARGAGGSQHNFGVKHEHWPFLYELIARHGAAYGLSPRLRPDDIHDLPPEQAHALARMMREHGRELLVELRAAPAASDGSDGSEAAGEAARRDAARAYSSLRYAIRHALHSCIHALAATRTRRLAALLSPESRERVDGAIASLRRDNHALMALPPAQIAGALDDHARELAELQASLLEQHRAHRAAAAAREPDEAPAAQGAPRSPAERRRLERTLARQQERAARADDPGALDDLTTCEGAVALPQLRARLVEMLPAATEAFDRRRDEELRQLVRSSLFERWVENASNPDRPLYDQPRIMVEAIDDVRAHHPQDNSDYDTHFYDGHHWLVVPRTTLEASPASYRGSLERDMPIRLRERQLERILMIMAESEGGRRILTSPEQDPTFHTVLRQVAGDAEAEAMLQRVEERVIAPIANSTAEGEAARAGADARDHGYY